MSRPLLLDSHVVLWLLDGSPRLGAQARDSIVGAPAVYVSAATLWELSIKSALGKLQLPDGFTEALTSSGLLELPIRWGHARGFTFDGLRHRDPFDAMLVAQAKQEGLHLLTADQKILDAWPEALDARQ